VFAAPPAPAPKMHDCCGLSALYVKFLFHCTADLNVLKRRDMLYLPTSRQKSAQTRTVLSEHLHFVNTVTYECAWTFSIVRYLFGNYNEWSPLKLLIFTGKRFREYISFTAAAKSLITDISAAINLTCTNVSQTTENNIHNWPLFVLWTLHIIPLLLL
jgi:hypothetical protein